MAIAFQRIGAIGTSTSWQGADRHRPMSALSKLAEVRHRGPDAIEPGAFVGGARRREGRSAQLLGIQTVGALLRRVAADRQGAGQGLGLEAVAEPGHVACVHETVSSESDRST